ncbi:MAG TPA: class I SAM-dependent methyltransferase [Azonexus sp.]|nr:class I SAM-dependent methyltransferase [Azonexus sp.]
MFSPTLTDLLQAALDARQSLIERLHAEDTNAYRLFNGSTENRPGLTVDRYGDLLLIQTFHEPLDGHDRSEIENFYASALPGLIAVYNDRSRANSRIGNPLPPDVLAEAQKTREFHEMGIRYLVQGRHGGQDPWLFLDMRAGRRRVMQEAAGKSVLNLFAYTCGIGVAAAKAGAAHVVNVDFAESSLKVGKDNARLNDLPIRLRFVQSDAFAAMRQLAGIGQPTVVRGKKMPNFPKLDAHAFDLVFLDPPRYAKSPFGVVDIINDYAALMKLALLCTSEGGTLICCNNAAQLSRDVWADQLQRCAKKAGRTIHALEWITPEDDFPSHDGQPPLKIALLRV